MYMHTQTHAHKYIFCIWLCTEEWNKEYMLMRTTCRAFLKMKHFQTADIVGMEGEGWTNSIEREVLADRLTKVHVAFPFTGERLGTTPPQQTRPWGITQLSIRSFHSDEWGLSRCLAENWREREAERRRFLICLPFYPPQIGWGRWLKDKGLGHVMKPIWSYSAVKWEKLSEAQGTWRVGLIRTYTQAEVFL